MLAAVPRLTGSLRFQTTFPRFSVWTVSRPFPPLPAAIARRDRVRGTTAVRMWFHVSIKSTGFKTHRGNQ